MRTLINRRTLSCIVIGVVLAGGVPPAAQAASPHRTMDQFATAVWTITDGCVETRINVFSGRNLTPKAPTTFFTLSQNQTCDDPNASMPVLDLSGTLASGVWPFAAT